MLPAIKVLATQVSREVIWKPPGFSWKGGFPNRFIPVSYLPVPHSTSILIHQFPNFLVFLFFYQINHNYHITLSQSLFSESNDINDQPTSPITITIRPIVFRYTHIPI